MSCLSIVGVGMGTGLLNVLSMYALKFGGT